jgi:hypothetical protein
MLNKAPSILGMASIATSVAIWSGGPQTLAAGGASRARFAATAYDCPRPEPGETSFGPYWTVHEAKRKCRSLELDGWFCRVKRCSECQGWYVFARRIRPSHVDVLAEG